MRGGQDWPAPVWIHPSRGMEAVAAQRREALLRGIIPNGFHYASLRQSQLWLEVARKYQPAGLETFYRGIFADLGKAGLMDEPEHVVGLGAGGARKERWLLERMQKGRRFTPVDVSVDLALLAVQEVAGLVEEAACPLVADVEAMDDLREWLDEVDGGVRRWFTAFGLTPNAEPGVLLPRLREAMRPGDALLLSANLLPGGGWERVKPEYDNVETRRWLGQVLVDWGLHEGMGDLEFVQEEWEGVGALVGRTPWKEDRVIDWEGRPFQARQGEWLRLFFTLRYTLEDLGRKLKEQGLAVERSWESACGREGVSLVRREN